MLPTFEQRVPRGVLLKIASECTFSDAGNHAHLAPVQKTCISGPCMQKKAGINAGQVSRAGERKQAWLREKVGSQRPC